MNTDGLRQTLTFEENLKRLPLAFERGIGTDSSEIVKAVLSSPQQSYVVIGSGASYSASVFLCKCLEAYFGIAARPKTPYEYYSGPNVTEGAILISAGGKNADILAALDKALITQTKPLIIVTAKRESRLRTNAAGYSHLSSIVTNGIDTEEREGFFGVQSLIAALGAFISMIPSLRAKIGVPGDKWCIDRCRDAEAFLERNAGLVSRIADASHVVSLATGWAVPCLVDFESKFVEGGLGWIEIAEAKNFTHGRYVNSLRRKSETAIVLFATKDSTEFQNRFLENYGLTFPSLSIISKNSEALGACELFIYAFYLFRAMSELRDVSVSCPEIPDQARRMFRGTSLYNNLTLRETLASSVDAIVRIKRDLLRQRSVNQDDVEQMVSRPVVAACVAHLFSTTFQALVCDYDGTLVNIEGRDDPIDRELIEHLERLLNAGIHIAIVTGRGMTVVESLQASLTPRFYKQVHCYLNNGAVLIRLDKRDPIWIQELDEVDVIGQRLEESFELRKYVNKIKIASHRSQIVLDLVTPKVDCQVRLLVEKLVEDLSQKLHIRTSGRCVDIFPATVSKGIASKDFRCRILGNDRHLGILILGDHGEDGGNDFELLQEPFSFSVDKIHWTPTTCFPVLDEKDMPVLGTNGTLSILRRLAITGNQLRLATSSLGSAIDREL